MYKKILVFIWELPQILLACMVILILKIRRRITGRKSFGSANVFYARNFPGGMSLGRFIFLNERYSGDESSIRHEYGHSIQSLYLGWLYLVIVGLPSIARAAIWRIFKLSESAYYKGYPENWADRLGKCLNLRG